MTSGIEMIVKLRAEEKEIQEELEKMRKPVMALEADLKHIQGAIAFYERKDNNKAITKFIADNLFHAAIPRLKGLTHEQAVIAIAKNNDGIVRTQDAKRFMIKAGIMKQTKNSTNMAHNAIKRTQRFERISPGEYRLKTELKSPDQGTMTGPREIQTIPLGRLTN